ncbi:hypothetical protein L6452_30063 [Arctium lappa]|uniref:Uncharacterized protein n=1 Tax=Arctium lappa TaxID=4217 RepID=A0ACB8ZIP9_ARCLA|nr:hypothetical protein L6452_30063 [Arctium lappa]
MAVLKCVDMIVKNCCLQSKQSEEESKSDECCKLYCFLQGCVMNQSQLFVFQIQICINKSEVSFSVGIITSSS